MSLVGDVRGYARDLALLPLDVAAAFVWLGGFPPAAARAAGRYLDHRARHG